MAEKQTEMLRDGARRKSIGAANRKRAEERSSFNAMLRAHRDVWQSAVSI